MTFRVVFLWDVPARVRDLFRSRCPQFDLVFPDGELGSPSLVAEADAAVGWRISPEQLDAAKRLRLFQTPAAGPEWHVPLFRRFPHIPACNSHGNARSVAESTVTLLLAQMKQVAFHDRAMRAGEWRLWLDDRPSGLVEGKTLGLLGLGAIARRVADLARAFGMKVRAVKRSPAPEPGFEWIGGPAEVKSLLAASDAVVVAIPLTPETKGMLNRETLAAAKPGLVLVNVSRGEVVEEDALFDALKNGPLGGAALDVWYDYRPSPDAQGRKFPWHRPFHELPNVTLSPHRAASPLDDLGRWEDIIENLERVARGEPPLNRIDLERGY
ncbi:MAG: NAD-binding D-isomer specific 2-hydroxyacid [Planctomycetota bacterium]|nr:MAG: NAD-binding D-isomer specific 2-hydroxyacid [Planctomycetota bacterium]